MDHAVLKVLSSGQSRNEKIRTLYTRTSAAQNLGTPQENHGQDQENLGPDHTNQWSYDQQIRWS